MATLHPDQCRLFSWLALRADLTGSGRKPPGLRLLLAVRDFIDSDLGHVGAPLRQASARCFKALLGILISAPVFFLDSLTGTRYLKCASHLNVSRRSIGP
jgi:hypothetical protein